MDAVSRRSVVVSTTAALLSTALATTAPSPAAAARTTIPLARRPRPGAVPKIIIQLVRDIRFDLDPVIPYLEGAITVVELQNGVGASLPLTTSNSEDLRRLAAGYAIEVVAEVFGLTDIVLDDVLVLGL